MSEAIVERALARARQAGAAQADAVLIESDVLEARARGDEVDFVKQARERTLGLRALVRGEGGMRTACTSTSDLSPEVVERMADETVALAKATADDPSAGLPEGGFATHLPDLDLFDPADRPFKVEERIADAKRAEAAARAVDPRITNSEGSQVGSDFSRVILGNTEGFLGSYEVGHHSIFSEPLATEGDQKQRDYWMSVANRLADVESPEDVGRRAAERAVRRLGAKQIPTCEAAVIFDPLTAPGLIGQVAGLLNGYAVYRGTSFLAGRIGEKIGADDLTIVDDARLPGRLGSKPFDGEGLATRRNVLLDRGTVRSYVLDTYSARKLGLASTGNANRGAGSPPGAGTTNLWLEPGHQSLEQIIASTERGLLVTELIGMGFNPVTGDYSRGAAGVWIEGGELRHPVEEVTIAGNFGDMLAAVDAVGNDLMWLRRTASPSLRIAKMTIAGA